MQKRRSERILWAAVVVLFAATATCVHAQEVVSIETGKLQGSSEGGVT
jgi:hypothetical protein